MSDNDNIFGACNEAHELARRRVTPLTPVTPVTPIVPTTPYMLAAHIFSEGNIMEDLQLAAELGKTLLERNRDLESNIRNLQTVNDDQTQEIEYLSKQTAALREVNNSRLRIYEQLEISIHDLEKSNQRLTAENAADKRKIKSSNETIGQLESRCDDLQKASEDVKLAQQLEEQRRGRTITKKQHLIEENSYRRSISCEHSMQVSEELLSEFADLKLKYENCEEKVRYLRAQRFEETKRTEDLEIELSCVSQENKVLSQQLAVLKDKGANEKCLEDELASFDETTSSRLCRKCLGLTDDTMSNQTMQDINDDIEELEYDRVPSDCAVMKLKNGGYAWGSQESLASLGHVQSYRGSTESSPKGRCPDAADNSLLSELDAQYRILIEKYEALLKSREQPQPSEALQEERPTIIDSGVDELSGPMSLMMTDITRKNNVSLQCQRCSTCTCDLKSADLHPKSIFEEFFEVETSSSGFSEGESRFVCKCTQTELTDEDISMYNEDAATPIIMPPMKCLDLTSPLNPCERRFQNTPQYKTLFNDIFNVLKKNVDEREAKIAFTRSILQSQQLVQNSYPKTCDKSIKSAQSVLKDENEENLNPNEKENSQNKYLELKSSQITKEVEQNSEKREELKRERPDFLDLHNSGTVTGRSSSKNRRRKRRQRNDGQLNDSVDQSSCPNVSVVPDCRVKETLQVKTEIKSDLSIKKTTEEANSVKIRCKHKQRTRKSRPIVNKILTEVSKQQEQPSVRFPSADSKKLAFNHPSVEVAKLIRLERTYADVLKRRDVKRERRN